MLESIQDTETEFSPDKVKKTWKAKIENKTLEASDVINYFKVSAPFFLNVSRKDNVSDIGESVIRLFIVKMHNKSVKTHNKEK